MNKKLSIMAATAAVSLSVLAPSGLALAAESTPAHQNVFDKIAQAFGLKKDNVQKVVLEHRTERFEDRQAKMEEQLSKAVAAGKITEAQKAMIIAKQKELFEYRLSLKDKTPKERREAMQQKREETKQWAKDNNIPRPPMHNKHGQPKPAQN